MGIDLVTANTDRYFQITDHADLTLPNGEWAVTAWVFVEVNSGTDFQYLISNNVVGANNSFNFQLQHDSASLAADKWRCWAYDGDGTNAKVVGGNPLLDTTAYGADSIRRLYIIQRTASRVEMWSCPAHGTAVLEDHGGNLTGFGASNGGDWYIGSRSDLSSIRFYGEIFGGISKIDSSFSQEEIEAMAAGIEPYMLRPNDIKAYWQAREFSTTLVDIIGGHNGTYTEVTPVSDAITAEHFPLVTPGPIFVPGVAAVAGGRIMSSLTAHGGLAGMGGIAGQGGGLAG